MRTWPVLVAISATSVGLAQVPDAAGAARTAVVRCCPALDCPAVVESLADRLPDGVVVGPEPGSPAARWVVEVCLDAQAATSELQDLVSGASDRRRVPVTEAAAGSEWTRRLVVSLVEAQLRTALEEATGAATLEPPEHDDSHAEEGEHPGEPPALLALTFATSFAAAGNIASAHDDAGITLGPAFGVGVVALGMWTLELGVAPTGVLSAGDDDPAVDVVPVSLAGGFDYDLGPVALGGALGAVAEYWEPGGVVSASGWRWGVDLSGRATLPVWRWLSVRLQVGAGFFPNSVVFGHDRGERPGIVCELGNWRWQAALGVVVAIPVAQESSP